MLITLKEFLSSAKFTESIKPAVLDISPVLALKLRSLGVESLAIREIDAGSPDDCEHEVAALENPIYDFSRFGFKVVASPRHADILVVTGPVTAAMRPALIKAYEATPKPNIVIALGDGAISGRISPSFAGTGLSKVADCIPVDLELAGDPPSPKQILETLLALRNGR